MRFYAINNDSDFKTLLGKIAPHEYAYNMQDKADLMLIYIKNLKNVCANIVKQDALSVGGDLICNKEAIFGGENKHDALLIITKNNCKKLIDKLNKQDFKLNKLADFLKLQINYKYPKKYEIMGVLNTNNESFNKSSRINSKKIIAKINQFIEDGVDIIDIGGASSRPNSSYIGEDEEFKNIKKNIDLIYKHKLFEKVTFSLDSFSPKCLKYALDKGFKIINDISGDLKLIKLAKSYQAKYVLMHATNEYLSAFLGKNHFNEYAAFNGNILDRVYNFFKYSLDETDYQNIILDIGIGFGKTQAENMLLIKHLKHFLDLNLPILVGASRKGVINHYHQSEVENRLAGTLFLHLQSIQNGASIIRVHDVFEHKQLLALWQAYKEIDDEL